ncbi:MAG TPA: phosphate/phosphite/phosphonate ABC transporter substrate-binding protein [Candidatus Binatia bacterium]
MTRFSRHITILFVAALSATIECRAAQIESNNAKTLALGVIFQGPSQPVENHFRPLVEYVAHKFSPAGETRGVIIVAPSTGQMIKLLEEKRVDFYMESPYPTYLINRLGAAKLLLRAWKGGLAEYRSLIFTSKQSGVTEPKELRGKIIAFEDPGSTSGYFLPKLFLLKKGFSVSEKASLKSKVSAREIGYIFANTSDDVVNLVLQQKVSAGAFSTDDYAGLEGSNKPLISILAETESVSRHLVSVRKDLPGSVVTRLKTILLTMNQDKEAQQILKQTDNTTKFDSLPGGEEMVRRKLVELYRPRPQNPAAKTP